MSTSFKAPQIQTATTSDIQPTCVLACKSTMQARYRTPQNTHPGPSKPTSHSLTRNAPAPSKNTSSRVRAEPSRKSIFDRTEELSPQSTSSFVNETPRSPYSLLSPSSAATLYASASVG